MKNKRGLSPIIATMLLVSLALVLAVIIFFWARNFIGENIEKQGQKIELLCEEVSFKAEAYDGKVFVENLGTVPLNGIEIKKKSTIGEIIKTECINEGCTSTITAGQTFQFLLPVEISAGEVIIVSPILLGETSSEKKSHVCGEEFGTEIVVGG